MKYVKKWMVVPYEETKLPTGQEKIQNILKNKSLNNDIKVKLIKQIKTSFEKNEEQVEDPQIQYQTELDKIKISHKFRFKKRLKKFQ